MHRVLVVVTLGTPPGAVHKLVRDDQRAGAVGRGERAHRARRQDPPNPERAQRPQVGAVGDLVRREPVVLAMPGQEGDPAALDLADEHRLARLTEWRLYPDLL